MHRLFLTCAALAIWSTPAIAQEAIEAGPIWNQGHADQVCPAIAASQGATWTGHWWTTIPNELSVCEIR